MRMKRHLLALVFFALAISLSGCGGSGGNSPTATSSTPTHTPVPTPTPTPRPTTDELFPHKAVWHFANKSGYTYTMTIALGEPTRIPENGTLDHPLKRDFSLDSACVVDPKRDVVIPAYWSAEATTVGFDTHIAMRALFTEGGLGTPHGKYAGYGVAPFMGDNRIRVAQNFTNGPSCETFSSTDLFGYAHSNGFSVQWPDPVPNGSVRTSTLFIVIDDYFSPATPQGDAALLNWIVLKPLFGGDFTDDARVYRDADGSHLMGIYSDKGMTLSGRVVDPNAPTPTPPPTETPTPDAYATRRAASPFNPFQTGDTVHVTAGNEPSMFKETGGGGIIANLPYGTQLTVVAGPSVVDDQFWWLVKDEGGTVGWVSDSVLGP